MREMIWHKDTETGRYSLINPWMQFWTGIGLAIGTVLSHTNRYHFATTREALSSLLSMADTLLATAIGVTTVIVVALACRMGKGRWRTKLARG